MVAILQDLRMFASARSLSSLRPLRRSEETKSKKQMSYLTELQKLSSSRGDDSLLHGGYIFFIQNKLSDEQGCLFLKAAIYGVLERIPNIIPPDLPELVEKDGFEPSEMLLNALIEMNENLIIPLYGFDVIRVIKAAREYEALARNTQ